MDLIRIIGDLREERKKLDQIIASLEGLQVTQDLAASTLAPRKGKRGMDADARMEVSRRMKKYWAKRQSKGRPDASPGNDKLAGGTVT